MGKFIFNETDGLVVDWSSIRIVNRSMAADNKLRLLFNRLVFDAVVKSLVKLEVKG